MVWLSHFDKGIGNNARQGDDNAQDYTDLGKRVQQKVVKSTTRMILGAA